MAPAPARYDYLQDVLSRQRPRCLQRSWDLRDAFWNNPRWQPHCDYMGVQLPKSEAVYRARYDMFGFADAPQHQADMSRVFKRMLNQTVLSDGQSELDQLGQVGASVSTKKTLLPATVKDFIGREIHSLPQLVTTSRSRAGKYSGAVGSLLADYPEGIPHSGDREYLTLQWATPEGVQAPTIGASGWQGGIAHRDWRHIVPFPPEECAPNRSSNFREASTAASAAELMGPYHRGERLLFRSDNSTTVSLINKQGTTTSSLWPVGERIFQADRNYDLDIACEHIPGIENGLSDGLSRSCWHKCTPSSLLLGWRQFPEQAGGVLQSLRELMVLVNASLGGVCPYCQETCNGILACCLECTRLLCHRCAGVKPGLTSFIRCSTCWARAAGWRGASGPALVRLVTQMLSMRVKDSTTGVQRRGVREVRGFLAQYADHGYPAVAQGILGYIAYAIEIRPVRLDSSTNRCLPIQWKAPPNAKDPDMLVAHNNEELSPRIRGSLVFDTNADARKPKRFYIPSVIPALGV
ncbi:hypothetical protein CYMTET_29738 [Cymbomonas tetramitiformis]|uniref:Uncharacterized protein n=1 Tax=Cymbomonas tetramitiformis TaxID=36881 RepID=A0AAE0FLU5_9CHLO|nr:hypothetical protein CYMTET_29738 [Cymbomonas tetramitiformis]